MLIINPTPSQVEDTLRIWDSLENYVLQESSLKKLFTITYPENSDIDDVLIKVCALNDFYSTNIFSPFTVAKHIVALDIDRRLADNDLKLVNDMAIVITGENKTRNFYSFASKYCSHHKPEIYPIYDSFAEKILIHFNEMEQFHHFNKKDLKNYPDYKAVILMFQQHYGLTQYSLKEIDKYLWIKGKEHFPKNYK